MASQLWFQQYSEYRRKGTTFKELQLLFVENITTKHIYEPLYSHSYNEEAIVVREILVRKEFDVVGITDDNSQVVGFAQTSRLKEGILIDYLELIDLNAIISESIPLSNLFQFFCAKEYYFVLSSSGIGIVTKADLNKPIARIYLFGIISLFEMHLNFWISNHYCSDAWKVLLAPRRLKSAEETLKTQNQNNESLTLLECLMLADKKMILEQTDIFLKQFEITKEQFNSIMSSIKTIRDVIAHSHNSIISTYRWTEFADTIYGIESFLRRSDGFIEK